jgi:hypothetical protein
MARAEMIFTRPPSPDRGHRLTTMSSGLGARTRAGQRCCAPGRTCSIADPQALMEVHVGVSDVVGFGELGRVRVSDVVHSRDWQHRWPAPAPTFRPAAAASAQPLLSLGCCSSVGPATVESGVLWHRWLSRGCRWAFGFRPSARPLGSRQRSPRFDVGPVGRTRGWTGRALDGRRVG